MEDILVTKTDTYRLFLIASIAAFLGWGMILYFKPMITETGCSEIAAQSSTIVLKNKPFYDPSIDYNILKAECLEGTRNTN